MAVQLGSQPDSGFDNPLALMSDCHRRVEKFLGILVRVSREQRGKPLTGEYREAAQAALRYFRNAAPWHTQDEEQSLFPRMRLSVDPEVQAALQQVDALEADHVQANQWHDDAHSLLDKWLEVGSLSGDEFDHLEHRLLQLQQTYQRHIDQEDNVIFPLAARTLSPAALTAIGREMAERRGVEPDLPPRRCRHGRGHIPATQPPSATGAEGATS